MPKFVKLLSSIFFVFIISYSYESSAKKAAIVIDFNTKNSILSTKKRDLYRRYILCESREK